MFNALLLLTLAVAMATRPCRADYTVTINPGTTWGVWDGWGCSLCWWANVFGYREDLADIVFTTNYTTLNGENLPGLGLNIARYNAGACTTDAIDGQTMVVSSNIPAFKQMQGYWLNWFSSDLNSSSWQLSADANQRAMLLNAQARGANLLELFADSPIWWMCYNHNPSGPTTAGTDNLQSWNYDQDAVCLATIAAYAVTNWGVTFNSVEAFNEPHGTWWTAECTQEGCYFDTPTQAAVIGYLRSELDNRGLTAINVSASDENTYDVATSTWEGFSASTQAQVGRVNVHGYQYGGGRRDLLYSAVAGAKLWNTEYGESDATGMSLASNLNLDFTWLHPTAWCYWQPFDSGGWGLVQSNPGDNWIGNSNPKYYVLAQYTRHIRPGMTILDSEDGNSVAAYSPAERRLVLVTANYGTPQIITYSLTNVAFVGGPIRRWLTASGTATEYVQYNDTVLANQMFESSFPTNAIQTFEIDNVDLSAPAVPAGLAAAAGVGRVDLSWSPSIGATNYVLRRATNAAGRYSILTSLTATQYTDTQVTNLTAYYYTVAAVNGAGASAISTPVSATPYSRPILAATLFGGQIALAWPGFAANFTVYYATNLSPPVSWFPITNSPQATNGMVGMNLPTTNAPSRFYRLGAN